ncbi:MAG: PPK2 family polyphosphate kinase [Eubacteriales bacterium]|nr:PPK2 family polyphosphate kinase [Eubacteriales bacterium]
MQLNEYLYKGNMPLDLLQYSTFAPHNLQKDNIALQTQNNSKELYAYFDKLYASKKQGIIIVLQAMDGAGKFSLIKNFFSNFNAVNFHIHSFFAPSQEEQQHDLFWRFHHALPKRGEISLLNYAYYEDCIQALVKPAIEPACSKNIGEIAQNYFAQIKQYEQYLEQSGYSIIKLFLHVSKDKQTERYLDRMQKPNRFWKFSTQDMLRRELQDDYIAAYAKTIGHTATETAPWYILPADHKWYTSYLASEILLQLCKKMQLEYPSIREQDMLQLPIYLDRLQREVHHEIEL